MTPLILDLASDGVVCGQLHTPPNLPLGKEFRLLYRRLVETQNWIGYFEEKKSLLTLAGIESRTDQAVV